MRRSGIGNDHAREGARNSLAPRSARGSEGVPPSRAATQVAATERPLDDFCIVTQVHPQSVLYIEKISGSCSGRLRGRPRFRGGPRPRAERGAVLCGAPSRAATRLCPQTGRGCVRGRTTLCPRIGETCFRRAAGVGAASSRHRRSDGTGEGHHQLGAAPADLDLALGVSIREHASMPGPPGSSQRPHLFW